MKQEYLLILIFIIIICLSVLIGSLLNTFVFPDVTFPNHT